MNKMHYSSVFTSIAFFGATVHSAAISPRGVPAGRNPYLIVYPDGSTSPPGNPISWCGGPNTQSQVGGPAPAVCNPHTTYTLGRDGAIPSNSYTWGDCIHPGTGAEQWYRITAFPIGATSCTLYFDQACMGYPFAGLTVMAKPGGIDLRDYQIPGLSMSFMSKVGSFSCVKGASTGQTGQNIGSGGQSGNTGSSDGTGSTGSTGGNGAGGEGQGGNTGACNAAGQCSGNTPPNNGKSTTTTRKRTATPKPRGSR